MNPDVYVESKSIKSNRAKVTNLINYIDYNTLINTIIPSYSVLTDHEIESIKKVEKKYATWEWNYGESPRFTYSRSFGEYVMLCSIRNGLIEEAFIKNYTTGTVWDPPLWIPYSSMLIGSILMILQYVAEIIKLTDEEDFR